MANVALMICDEAARIEDPLYYSVQPMLAVSQSRLIALSTPFGRRGWFFHEGKTAKTGRDIKLLLCNVRVYLKIFGGN
jgi:hypothetical protein